MIENSNIAAKLSTRSMAGAFYYACEIEGLSLLPSDAPSYQRVCEVELSGTNRFRNNSANDGGAIMWTRDRPAIGDSTVFSDNSAFYGTNIGSYPGKLQMDFISNNDYVNPYNKSASTLRRVLQDASSN
jgi:hypothetical protein